MKTKDLVVHYINRGFNGCHLRSESDLIDRLSADFGCAIGVEKKPNDTLHLHFDVEDGLVIEIQLLPNPINGMKNWCRNIKIVE